MWEKDLEWGKAPTDQPKSTKKIVKYIFCF